MRTDPACWQFYIAAAVAREVPEAREEIEREAGSLPAMRPPLPDPQGVRERVAANLRAIAIVSRLETGTVFDLLAYSGWGGLGDAFDALPGSVRTGISREELIAAFYTPHFLAFEMARLAMRYAPRAQTVLDPAAGSGRLLFPLAAVGGYRCIGIELQRTTAAVLRRWGETLNVRVIEGPFEKHFADVGRPDLVISNPPYGERALRAYDREFARTSRAHVYFLLRSTTLLAEGGVGVFLMPDGFLTGDMFQEARRAWLANAKLLEAWQLPADLFPGAKVNTSVLVFSRRATPWVAEDEEIARGRYFALHPERVQGVSKGGGKGRWSLVRLGPASCLIGPLPPTELPKRAPSRAEAPAVELVSRAEWLLARADQSSIAWQLDVAAYRRAGGVDPRLPQITPRIPAPDRARREWAQAQIPVAGPFDQREQDELVVAGWRNWPGRGWVPTPLYGSLAEISALPNAPKDIEEELSALLAGVASSVADSAPWTARWLPLGVIQGWLAVRSEGALVLREGTVVVIRGTSDAPAVMAQINGDDAYWGSAEADERKTTIAALDASWIEFIRTEPWRTEIRLAHARTFRLTVPPPRDSTPQPLPRWDLSFRTPHHYQWAEANKVLRGQRNLTGFDVGLGKTLTAILAWALLRQAGQAQRTLVIVPSSTVPGWVETWRRAVPDVRLMVIGADLDSEPPKSEPSAKRAMKFRAFADGAAEVAVVTRDAFKSLRVNRDEAVEAVLAEDSLRRVAFGEKGGITSRELARKEASAKSFVDLMVGTPDQDDMAFPMASELGVEHVIVDEAQAYANLVPPPVWAGHTYGIAFVGSSGQVAQRAWHLTLSVRPLARSGTSTHFLTATPASNGMLDLYNVSQALGNPWPERTAREWLEAYARLGDVIKERSTGKIEEVTAVVGFQREAEFFRILDNFATFASARSVGLPLPEALAERVLVPAGGEGAGIVAMLERMALAAKKRKFSIVRKYFTLLNMAAVHPSLVDPAELRPFNADEELFAEEEDEEKKGYAPPSSAPPSAKFRAVLERLDNSCGHIVFLDYTAAQGWLAAAIRATGRSVEVLSGEVPIAERGKIRDRFNGGETDVVIVGGVGQEGVDLQKRTCAVHHVDLPWTPARLEQRNGRAVRQGSGAKVVNIYYYLLSPSGDSLRLQVVLGKGGALDQLIERRSTNNPAADAEDISIVDLLREASGHSDRFDEWISRLEENRDEVEARKREERRVSAIMGARARFVGGLDSELSEDLDLVFPVWERLALRQPEVLRLQDPEGRAWWTSPGQWVDRHGDPHQVTTIQTTEGPRVVLRPASTLLHEVISYASLEHTTGTPVAPPLEDVAALRKAVIADLPWSFFPTELAEAVWSDGPPEHLEEERGFPREKEGRLVAGPEGELLPPTAIGYDRARALPYGMSRSWIPRWRSYWREPLPQRPTVEEQTIFQARNERAVDEAALSAVFRVPRALEGASVGDLRAALVAPVGGGREYAEGETLLGPGFAERSVPSANFDPTRLFSDHIARTEITRVTRLLGPGIAADGLLLADGRWRAAVRDLGLKHQWMWIGLDAFDDAAAALAWASETWTQAAQRLVAGETIDVKFERRQAIAGLARDIRTEAMVLGVERERSWVGRFIFPILVATEIGPGSGRDGQIVHGMAAAQFAQVIDRLARGEPLTVTVSSPGAIMGGGVVVQTTRVRDLHLGRVERARLAWTTERRAALTAVTYDSVIVHKDGLVASRSHGQHYVSREVIDVAASEYPGQFFQEIVDAPTNSALLLLENSGVVDIASRSPMVLCMGKVPVAPWDVPTRGQKFTAAIGVAGLEKALKGVETAYLYTRGADIAAAGNLILASRSIVWLRVGDRDLPVLGPEIEAQEGKAKPKKQAAPPVLGTWSGNVRISASQLRDAIRYASRALGSLRVGLAVAESGVVLIGSDDDFWAINGSWVADAEMEGRS